MNTFASSGDAVDALATRVADELRRATAKFPSFNSGHEGWVVIREELDELWEHVRGDTWNTKDAEKEAVQVAAMGLRFALDLCSASGGSASTETPTCANCGHARVLHSVLSPDCCCHCQQPGCDCLGFVPPAGGRSVDSAEPQGEHLGGGTAAHSFGHDLERQLIGVGRPLARAVRHTSSVTPVRDEGPNPYIQTDPLPAFRNHHPEYARLAAETLFAVVASGGSIVSGDVISFTVPGQPRPKGRPRFTRRGFAYTPKATVEHEAAIAWSARAVHTGKPLGGPLRFDVAFHMANARRVDGDNLLKLVWDALNGVLWLDDSQIVEFAGTVHVDRENPRTEIEVRLLEKAAA